MTAQNTDPVPPEFSAVAPEESLLRRVPPHWYPDPEMPQKPQWLAFKPTPADVDGLSVGRRRLVVSIEDYSFTPDHTKRRSVVQVRASHVYALRMTVKPKPLPKDAAHAIIPEMNVGDYKADGAKKRAIKEWALRLAHQHAEMVYVFPTTQAG